LGTHDLTPQRRLLAKIGYPGGFGESETAFRYHSPDNSTDPDLGMPLPGKVSFGRVQMGVDPPPSVMASPNATPNEPPRY